MEEKTKEELDAEMNVVNKMEEKNGKYRKKHRKIKESLSGGVCRPEPDNKTEPNKNPDINN